MNSIAARTGVGVGVATSAVAWALDVGLGQDEVVDWTQGAVSGLVIGGLTWFGVRRALGPLKGIASRLAAADEESLERLIPAADLPAELRDVAQQANALFDRLDGAFERERRTTSNIAHELRTPIAELRGLTEVAMRLGDDAEFASKTVAESYSIAVEMDRIATTLLRVARAQAGQLEIRKQDLEADEQLRAAVDTVHEMAQRRGIEFEVDRPDEISVLADPDLLDLILVNLLTNAAQHAPKDDHVRCTVKATDGAVDFVIENTNTGLTEEDMPHLTETFWKKKDEARKDPVHTGLGLALVDQLAASCGFSFSLTLVEDRVRATLGVPTG
ncbi:MAG: ATP-binding protein [Planctomycetota bacterium]|jgi:two-component system sensor histidine kinase QseC